MALRMLFFAQCADWTNRREMDVPLEEPAMLSSVLRRIPELSPILERQAMLKVSINCEFSSFSAEVRDGDEVAFLPPVSGG